jgi:hypothetical protein
MDRCAVGRLMITFGRVVCWWVPAPRWVPGGRWIGYTAAQVALRRAARLVCVVVGMGAGGAALAPPALPWREHAPTTFGVPVPYAYPPGFFVPISPPETFSESPRPELLIPIGPLEQAPEPSTIVVLALSVAALALVRR